MYVAYLCPIITYAYETWSAIQEDEKKLLIFESKLARKIYGSVLTGDYERNKNTK